MERVTALANFVSNYVPIVRTLMSISHRKDCDAKANKLDLLKVITNRKFIVTLFSFAGVINNVDLLSKILQQKAPV